MNGRSCGYLVRALNKFASLAARCGLKDVHAMPAKVPIRSEGASRKSRTRRSARPYGVIQNEQLCHVRKK